MYTLNLKYHFDASHKLENYEGACSNLHGHRWNVEVKIKTGELQNDMVIDFKKLKGIIDRFDHKSILQNKESNGKLVDILSEMKSEFLLVDFNPTAENLAQFLHGRIWEETGNIEAKNIEVTIWESPDASITYSI